MLSNVDFDVARNSNDVACEGAVSALPIRTPSDEQDENILWHKREGHGIQPCRLNRI
jgi:hypothetical protein